MPVSPPNASLMAQIQINMMDLFGKLYTISQSNNFTGTQPAIWQCSDESQGIKKALFGYVFDCPVFNLGNVGAIVNTDRMVPASHHGQDIVIVGGSHIGAEVAQGIGFIDRINGKKAECCGMLFRILDEYLQLYKTAQSSITIHQEDDQFYIEIPYRYLQKHLSSTQPEIIIHISKLINGDSATESSQGKVFQLNNEFTAKYKSELSTISQDPTPINTLLDKDLFVFEENINHTSAEAVDIIKASLIDYMPEIVTCTYPHRRIADINTWREFHKITAYLIETFQHTDRNIFLVAGLTVDYSIKKNMFVPQFGFSLRPSEKEKIQYFNPIEINEYLREIDTYSPQKTFMEYAGIKN